MNDLRLPSIPLPLKSRLVVGVSGGADSVALLEILARQWPQSKETLFAAHVNYGLRKGNSEKDEELVRSHCRARGIQLRVLKLKGFKKKRKSEKRSLQDYAREIRYSFFARLVKEKKAWGVVVAHHLEDQAETILDRLLRGAGPRGLSGLREVQELFIPSRHFSLKIWRPFLPYTKSNILEFLEKWNIPWREDETNFQNHYRRNQIRNQIIPFLSEWNPTFTQSLFRIGEITSAEDQYLDSIMPLLVKRVRGIWRGRSFEFYAPAFHKIHMALKRRFVRFVVEKSNNHARGLSFRGIQEIIRLWEGYDSGPRDLGYNLSAGIRGKTAFLKRKG